MITFKRANQYAQKYDAGNPQQPMDEDIAITSGYVHRGYAMRAIDFRTVGNTARESI